MDEIDNIILHSLRQIGCVIDDEICSLSKLTPSILVQTVSKCLTLINPSLDLPKTMPPGMAQRFTVTTSLAEACATIGYRRDIGYQTFLYSNVAEIRKVFMFLIERLPKESEKSSLAQPVDKTTALENEIIKNITSQLHSPWMPDFCRNTFMSHKTDSAQTIFKNFVPKKLNIPFVTQADIVGEIKEFWGQRTPSIFEQTDQNNLIPSIIATNDGTIKSNRDKDETDDANAIGKAKLFKLSEFNQNLIRNNKNLALTIPTFEKSDKLTAKSTTEDKAITKDEQTESPLDALNKEIDKLRQDIDHNITEHSKLVNSRNQKSEMMVENGKVIGKLKEEKKIKERTHILLEDPEINVKKLEIIIASSKERMNKLSEQWEEHRMPLTETLEASKAKNSQKMNKSQQIIDQIASTKQKLEEVTEDLRNKTILHTRLLQEFESMNKNINRTAYTSRILEIIGNIRKQKTDIDKILKDTRSLQREINSITGQLERQFTVTDDLIFRTAKKDEYSRKSYKLLVTLHSDCNDLITLVQEIGAVMREVRDLEDQIENEKSRNVSTNLERITEDLKQMENESRELAEKIRHTELQLQS